MPVLAVQTPDAHGVAFDGCTGRVRSVGLSFLLLICFLAPACSEINVLTVDVAQVRLEPDSVGLVVGDTVRMVATLVGSEGHVLRGRDVEWSSSNAGVAAVSEDGRVIGLAAGQAKIVAASEGVRAEATVTVAAPPRIGLSQSSLLFTLVLGSPAPSDVAVAVTNEGEGVLEGLAAAVTYASGEPNGWLSLVLTDVQAPATMTLGLATATLMPGTYQASVNLSARRAEDRALAVVLEVRSQPPAIVLGMTQVTFQAQEGGPDPAVQVIPVDNGGGGTLSALGASVTYAAGQPTDWLIASLSPSTAPGTLMLAARTGSLTAGIHSATVHVVSNVADNSPQNIAVTFELVGFPPQIGIATGPVDFSVAAGGPDPPDRVLSITNDGGGTLNDLTVAIRYSGGQPSGWLAAALSNATAPSTLMMHASTGNLTVATYTAFIDIEAADASNSPQTIRVNLTVTPAIMAPAISLGSSSVAFNATVGGADPAAQTDSVNNSGGGTLEGLAVAVTYASGQPTGWLDATLSSTTAPAAIVLQATTGTLAAATYNAIVALSASGASNSPQIVDVTFTVAATPASAVIGLTPASVTFSGVAGGANPADMAVAVSNTGTGTLSGLAVDISYGTGQPAGWLTATLNRTSAPATITLNATTGTLAAGTYTASLAVSAPGAANSPQNVDVTFTLAAPPVPVAPSNLKADRNKQGIELTWKDNSTNEDEFVVQRSSLLQPIWSAIATLAAGTTDYDDGNVTRGVTYFYRVLACNVSGCSASGVVAKTF